MPMSLAARLPVDVFTGIPPSAWSGILSSVFDWTYAAIGARKSSLYSILLSRASLAVQVLIHIPRACHSCLQARHPDTVNDDKISSVQKLCKVVLCALVVATRKSCSTSSPTKYKLDANTFLTCFLTSLAITFWSPVTMDLLAPGCGADYTSWFSIIF